MLTQKVSWLLLSLMGKQKPLKKIVAKTHLILGLLSGIVVFIIAITGCCWVFQEEIQSLVMEKIQVTPKNESFISPERAKKVAQTIFPDKHIHGTIFGHASDPLEVVFYEAKPEFYQSVFLNPYSGEVLTVKNYRAGFFWFVLDGHLNLWLPKSIGSQITAYSTMIFVVMLISGIILWWPKSKKNLKQRIQFDWKKATRWRRKNFDMHSVLGFYAAIFALVIAFSGLIMAFNWIYYVTYKGWGGENAPQFIIPANVSKTSTLAPMEKESAINRIIPMLRRKFPNYDQLELHYPNSDTSSIYVEISYDSGIYYNSDYRFFDQRTLQEIESPSIYGRYDQSKLADKVIRMNYDIHVGAIGGLFGKILAFLISLVTASLPITGFLLWWGRKNKKKPIKSSYKKPEPQFANQKQILTR